MRGPRTEFFVQLPEHAAFPTGSELKLGIEFSSNALPHVYWLRVAVNQEVLPTPPIHRAVLTEVRTALAPKLLHPGWNKIAIELLHSNSLAAAEALTEPTAWGFWASNTFLTVAYRRFAPFPELARFPHSYAEDKLLRPALSNLVEVFVPAQRRNVHARGLAILAARFGQVDYVRDPDLGLRLMSDWTNDDAQPHAIIVGRVEELPPLSLPDEIESRRRRLSPNEGLLAEWIIGQRRCLLVSGADDVGLEKTLLTLGSSPALIWSPPSPVVIDSAPERRTDLAYLRRPHSGHVSFESFGWSPLLLRGIMREENLSGWRLPPGYVLNDNSGLHLNIITAPALTNSSLEVLVNGLPLGKVELTPEFASLGSARLDLPAGLRGRDPMIFTLRTRLFSTAPAASNAVPWVSVLGTSRLEVRPQALSGNALDEWPGIFFSDPFLNKLAFALPQASSSEELHSFLAVMLQVGRNLPSSAILWPEAVYYSGSQPPQTDRLQNRHVVVLGAAPQWRQAFPPHAALPVESAPGDRLLMQGRPHAVSAFQAELTLVQLTRSPWDEQMTAVAAGGWKSFAAVPQMLMRPDAFLFGNVSVIDDRGRVTAYDTRNGNNESLAERIQRDLPTGLDPQETNARTGIRDAVAAHSDRLNTVVWIVTLTLLCLLIATRVWFTWDQNERRRKAIASEKPATA